MSDHAPARTRDLDIVVYGASGFVGVLTAKSVLAAVGEPIGWLEGEDTGGGFGDLLSEPPPEPDAIAEAEEAQTESVERLEEDGVDAAGEVGESEPAQAIDDALVTFAADRIVIFSHPEGDRDYREDEALAAGEERWNVPVTHALISR